MDDQSTDPRDEIVRLEERIEELAAKIESCRKFILASRISVAGGSLVLVGMLFGVIGFDPAMMAGAVAALLGGIAVSGSNRSTAQQAAKELTSAKSYRSVLIEKMAISDVTPLRGFSSGSQYGTPPLTALVSPGVGNRSDAARGNRCCMSMEFSHPRFCAARYFVCGAGRAGDPKLRDGTRA